VVARSLLADVVAAGNPARVLREITEADRAGSGPPELQLSPQAAAGGRDGTQPGRRGVCLTDHVHPTF
jgi:hypothetical protein